MKPALILAAGYSAPLFDPERHNALFDVYCINHAYRLYDKPDPSQAPLPEQSGLAQHAPSLAHAHVAPLHYCCLDSPMLFSRGFLQDPAITKHTADVHLRWLAGCPNCKTYSFDKKSWLPEDGNPFTKQNLQKPYLTFLFALQLAVRHGYRSICFLGCDFNLTQDQNYYFDSELNEKQFTDKFRAQEKTLEVFSQWLPYLDDRELISLSPQSRLNEWLKHRKLA